MCNFRVGQKVVCVDASLGLYGREAGLELRKIYEVDGIFTNITDVGLSIVGLKSSHITGAFKASRFRPVVERKADISVLTRLLNTTPEKVDA